ncbi:MAG TPA: hypothetical protein VF240_16315 [Pyrinomonadaceae bacterium]
MSKQQHSLTARARLAAALTLLLACFSGAHAQQAGGAKGAMIFAVSGEMGTTIDPVVLVSGGKFVSPPMDESGDDPLAKFAGEYYREGRKFRIISGGGEAGSLTVKRSHVADECFRTGADVELESPVKIGRVRLALATDSDTLGRGQGTRRAPTEAERAAALKLAEESMRRRRVPAAVLKTLGAINLTATDLDGDGRAELIGSFVAKQGKQSRHLLFLIALPQADTFKTGLARYETVVAKDLPDPSVIDEVGNGGFLSEILVDQVDLDGDRVGEVVTTGASFEGQWYYIYKRGRGGWSRAYESSNYRCAY